mgnify:CR=1 FL=1
MKQALATLTAERFACEQGAITAITVFRKTRKIEMAWDGVATEAETYTLRHTKRGHPKAEESRKTSEQWKIVVTHLQAKRRAVEEEQRQGMFILMIEHADDEA